MAPFPSAWRVESDGRPAHTALFDGQGNLVPLDGIVAIRWEVTAGNLGRLTIVAEASANLTGETTPIVEAGGPPPPDQPPVPNGKHCETGP